MKCINNYSANKKILFGFDPLINNKYWAEMLRERSYNAESVVIGTHAINKKNDFDIVIDSRLDIVFQLFRCIIKYDVLFLSFNGGMLSFLGFPMIEPYLFKILGIKVVTLAYGSDISSYDLIDKPSYLHVLNSYYPQSHKKNRSIKNNLRRWQKHSDFVVPSMFFNQGLYRNDLLTPNSLIFPVEQINHNTRVKENKTLCIVHSPNHRIIKGSEYIIDVVKRLQKEIDIEFILLENRSNQEVLSILRDKADIFIEKLIGPSYALSAIEAMAHGVPVIGSVDNGDWNDLAAAFRRYSFLSECPIISANVESLQTELRELCTSPNKRRVLSLKSREYVKKYHSYHAGQIVFSEILKYVDGQRNDLKNFYHPITGEYYKYIHN